MILDGFLMFDTVSGAITTAGTYTSTNVIDLHIITPSIPVLAANQGARDIGIGDDPALKLLVQVTVAFTSGGSPTLQVVLQGAPDNGSGAPGTFVSWWTSPVYAFPQIQTVGARLMDMDMPRPPNGFAIPRFLRLQYITTGTITGGNLEAGIVLDRHDQMYQGINNAILGGYPPGIIVAN